MRNLVFLVAILISATSHATSGRRFGPEVYTIDALEINWRYTWHEAWGPNLNRIKVAKISFCQLIYWDAVSHDPYEKAPRKGWASCGWTMYEVKTETKNGKTEKIRELKDHQTKVSFPRRNWNDGYWYVTVRDGTHTIKVRTKILIGGIDGTDTLIDPDSADRNLRHEKRTSPISLHREIMKARQDVLRARRERHQKEEALTPNDQESVRRQDDLDSLEPVDQ